MASLAGFNEKEIEKFVRTFETIFYQGEALKMASYYTENAQLMADGIKPMQGRSDIAVFWEATCERAKNLNMERTIHIDEIMASSDLGYTVSTVVVKVQLPNGQKVVNTVNDITIWRKQADETWKIEVDISNQNPPTKTA